MTKPANMTTILNELHELNEIVRAHVPKPHKDPKPYTTTQRLKIMLNGYKEVPYVELVTETAKAWLIWPGDDEELREPSWFAKSQCQIDMDKKVIHVSDWLYDRKVVEGAIKKLKDKNQELRDEQQFAEDYQEARDPG